MSGAAAAQQRSGRLPCVVLGLETQIGLAIARELGRSGVPVVGIAQEASAIGLRSRYVWRRLVVEARSPQLLQTLRELGEELGPCPLIAISEVNLVWLARHRDQVGRIVPLLPDDRALAIVLDKQATLVLAKEVGLRVPWSVQPRSPRECDEIASRCTDPAVLKWSDPNAIVKPLAAAGLPLLKAEYVYSQAQLREALARYDPIGAWPLVQEYCPGYGLGQFFFIWDGVVRSQFQHRRIGEWPPEGGFSATCDAVPLSEFEDLRERSIALLRRIGWSGVAMVEFRLDPDNGAARLMEINGRFWGSFPLAVHCRVGFARDAYEALTGDRLPASQPRRDDLRCRLVGVEIKRLLRIVLQPSRIADRRFAIEPLREIWRFLADFLRPRVRYAVWSIDDPVPLLKDLANAASNVVRRGRT